MTFCEEWSLVKIEGRQASAEPLYCRSWKCPVCAPKRKKQLMAECLGGNPTTFLTLTINTNIYPDPDDAAKALSRAFRCLLKRIKRDKDIERIPFMAVFEQTKRGWPHLHILLRMPYVDHQWIAEQMDDLIESPVCWIEKIDDPIKAAAYVSKYCSKNPHRFGFSKRYWQSRDYDQRTEEERESERREEPVWQVIKYSLHTLASNAHAHGWTVDQQGDNVQMRWSWPNAPPTNFADW